MLVVVPILTQNGLLCIGLQWFAQRDYTDNKAPYTQHCFIWIVFLWWWYCTLTSIHFYRVPVSPMHMVYHGLHSVTMVITIYTEIHHCPICLDLLWWCNCAPKSNVASFVNVCHGYNSIRWGPTLPHLCRVTTLILMFTKIQFGFVLNVCHGYISVRWYPILSHLCRVTTLKLLFTKIQCGFVLNVCHGYISVRWYPILPHLSRVTTLILLFTKIQCGFVCKCLLWLH